MRSTNFDTKKKKQIGAGLRIVLLARVPALWVAAEQ